MRRNIILLKIILPLITTWFWMGIWVIYYLRFTNFAGIGLIETFQISSSFLLEIPTGIVADIFGKKKTLLIALSAITVGNTLMGISTQFIHLLISVFFISAGYAFCSGTMDALLYESLQEINQGQFFEKILARIETYKLMLLALSSIMGGFLYTINPRSPYFFSAICSGVGLLAGFFLKESNSFTKNTLPTISNYFLYARRGFTELFSQSLPIKKLLLELITISASITLLYEVLDNSLAIRFGLNQQQLGVFFAGVIILAAGALHYFEKLKHKQVFSDEYLLILFSVTMLSSLFSPFYGLIVGCFSIILRNSFYPFFRIKTSSIINSFVDPDYRTTTLSTFTLLTKIPYIVFAYGIGRYMDSVGSAVVASFVSIVALGIIILIKIYVPNEKQ